MPKRTDLSDTLCPVGRSAELLGDRAVLLILRELFFGVRRFELIQQNSGLGAQLLSRRLKMLVDEGVIERRPYRQRPVRLDYWLTDKGKALFDVLYAMRNWAENWCHQPGEVRPAIRYIHRACGHDVGYETICPACGEALGYGDLKGEPSPALSAERVRCA